MAKTEIKIDDLLDLLDLFHEHLGSELTEKELQQLTEKELEQIAGGGGVGPGTVHCPDCEPK